VKYPTIIKNFQIAHKKKKLVTTAKMIGTSYEKILLKANLSDSSEKKVAVCLCLTIAELYGAVILVINSPYQNQIAGLIRPMHEALVTLKNLVKSGEYLKQIRYNNAEQMMKIIKAFLNDPEMQDDVTAMTTIEAYRAIEEPVFNKYETEGISHQSIACAFKNAGMIKDYGVGYGFLCSCTHNNLSALLARHVRNGHLMITDNLPNETFESFLTMAVGIYTQAMNELHNFTDISQLEIDSIINAADNQWQLATK